MTKPIAQSRSLGAKVIYAAMQILIERGGEAPSSEVVAEIPKRVQLDDWATNVYEKSGYVRWKSILFFFTIDLIKAGFMVKKQGVWYCTPEGEEAMKLGELGLLDAARAAYSTWRKNNPVEQSLKPQAPSQESDLEEDDGVAKEQEATIQEMEALARESLEAQIRSKNAYEFQDMVAALLRAMGYYTPFVAPKGKDGGVDVIAYQDPLGVVGARIKVQVKHRENTATVQEIRELMGLLRKAGDAGMFVSSGGFTSDAKVESRSATVHVELLDLDAFIGLWREFYPKMSEDDKNLLRLKPIYFFDPS